MITAFVIPRAQITNWKGLEMGGAIEAKTWFSGPVPAHSAHIMGSVQS